MTIDFNGLKWNRYLTENVPDGDDVDIVQDGYIKNGKFYETNSQGGIRIAKYIQNIDGSPKVRYAEYSKLFLYGDAPNPPSSPLSDSLQVDLELELLGSRNTNDLTQFWDSSGNDRHGTAINGFNVNSGLKGNALYGLSSSSQRLDITNPSSTIVQYSLSFWIYGPINSSIDRTLALSLYSTSSESTPVFINNYITGYVNETITIVNRQPGSGSDIGYVEDTKPEGWHHIVINKTRSTAPGWDFWIDGVKSTTVIKATGGYVHLKFGTNASIGWWHQVDSYADVYADLLRCWSRVLTEDEISELYNDGDGI